MHKLSQRHLKKFSKRQINTEALIQKMRETVKNDPIIIEKFKEYGVSLDEIDTVPITFCKLDVSAKTKNKRIYLNENMLSEDSTVKDPKNYLSHEIIHFLQQSTGKNLGRNQADDYLSRDSEIEAFKIQIQDKKENEGEEEAEKYVDRLLSHHDLHGKERKEKEKELLEE